MLLDRHPFILRVSREVKMVLELSANESRMVVGRRINEVADDLARGPRVPARTDGAGRCTNCEQSRRSLGDGLTKIGKALGYIEPPPPSVPPAVAGTRTAAACGAVGAIPSG